MWIRTLTFWALCLAGVGAIATNLFSARSRRDMEPLRRADFQADGFQKTVARVNREFNDHWKDQSLEVAKRADDFVIARRLSLGLTGTVPSLEELRMLESRGDDRIAWWINHLLADRRYADYVAERLARSHRASARSSTARPKIRWRKPQRCCQMLDPGRLQQ